MMNLRSEGRPRGPAPLGRLAADQGTDRALRSWRDAASDALVAAVESGAEAYDRGRVLPRLIAIDPAVLSSCGPELADAIRIKLESALRSERRRGRRGHWSYDLNRHVALLQALSGERMARRP